MTPVAAHFAPHTRLVPSKGFSLEALEPRRFMSATLKDGVFTMTGTDGPDRVFIEEDATTIRIERQCDPGPEGWIGHGELHFLNRADVKLVRVELGGGNDAFFVDQDPVYGPFETPLCILGGDGNDTIAGGVGIDTIAGGAGDDWIDGDGYSDGLARTIFGATEPNYDSRFKDLYSVPGLYNTDKGDALYADDQPAGPAAAKTGDAPTQTSSDPTMAVAPPEPATSSEPVAPNPLLKQDDGELLA
jgi:hypothetical protein